MLLLLGCSGGAPRSGGTAAPPPGPSGSGSLQLRVDARQLSAQPRGSLRSLAIRVVDASDVEVDVVDPVVIPVTDQSGIVTTTIEDIPLGMRRIQLTTRDDEDLILGQLLTEPFNIVAGVNPTIRLVAPGVGELRFRTQPSGTLVNQVIAPPVVVELVDATGALLTGSNTVTLSLAGGAGVLGGIVSTQSVNGVATFANLSVAQAGTGLTLVASSNGFGSASSDPFDVATDIGPPAQLVFITQPTGGVVGGPVVPDVQVVVQDANGITVPTATDPISLALGSNPGATSLVGTTSVVPTNGVATFTDLHINVPGNGYTLVATSGSLTGFTSAPFDITNTGTQLAFGTQPVTSQARAVTPVFTVEVQDQFGNLVPTASNAVTIALDNNPGPATLNGTLTVNAINGIATFNAVDVSRSGTGYTLLATSPGLVSATSAPFDQTFPRGYLVPLASGFPVTSVTNPARGDFSQDGNFIYIAEFNTSGLVHGFSVDSATGALTPTPGSPYATGAVSSVGGFRIASDNITSVATLFDTSQYRQFTRNPATGVLTVAGVLHNATPGVTPLDLAIRPGATLYAYIAQNLSEELSGFDLTTNLNVPGSPSSAAGATPNLVQRPILHPNNNLVFVNTGFVFSVNPADGGITNVPGSPFTTAEGFAQAIDPTGTFLYTGLTGGQISVHTIDPATGFLTPIAGSPFTVGSGNLSGLRIVLNGEFLYVHPFGSPDMLIFAVDPTTGVPTEIDDSPAPVTGTFDSIVDPLNRFLYMNDRIASQVFGFSIVP